MAYLRPINFNRRIAHAAAMIFALTIGAAYEAPAQSSVQGVPNAMQGFSQNRDAPIQIEAASLEMRDKKKEATFSGNVKVVQGDTTMTSEKLVVFYESSSVPGAPHTNTKGVAKTAPLQSATPGPGGSSSIKRLEARGSDPERPGRDRRDRSIQRPNQSDYDARRGPADAVQECTTRRSSPGRYDDGRFEGRIR
jgi:lipopolysaccharide export system protein LptA